MFTASTVIQIDAVNAIHVLVVNVLAQACQYGASQITNVKGVALLTADVAFHDFIEQFLQGNLHRHAVVQFTGSNKRLDIG